MREALISYPDLVIGLIKKYPIFARAILSAILVYLLTALSSSQIYSSELKQTFREIKLGIVGNVVYLNPVIQTGNENEKNLNALLYKNLVNIKTNGDIIPGIAKTWTISADGKQYTLYLDPTLKWHDGTPVTADDVAETFNKIKQSHASTAIAKALKDINFYILDPHTVRFELSQPNAVFLELLNRPIAPAKYIKDYTYAYLFQNPEAYEPVGNSVYKLEKYSPETINFAPLNLTAPSIKVFTFNSEYLRKMALLKGDINSYVFSNPTEYTQLKKHSHFKLRIFKQAFYTRVIYFNLKKSNSPVTNLNFRNAIMYAINRKELIRNYPGAEPAYGPYPEISWAYDPFVLNYKYNLALAKEFAEKLKDLKSVTLTYADDPTNQAVAEQLKAQLAKVNIKLKLRPESTFRILQEILPARDFEMLLFGIQTTIDPDQYELWHSSNIAFPGLNIAGLSSKRIDFFLEQARISTDRLKRRQYYLRFQRELFKHVPVVYLYRPPIYLVTYEGIEVPQTDNYIYDASSIYQRIYKWKINRGLGRNRKNSISPQAP